MKTTKIFTIIAALMLTAAATAQTQHEVSVYAGGGLGTLQDKFIEGKGKQNFGGNAGFGYTYFFNKHWGLGTGIGASFFSGKYNIPSLPEQYNIPNGFGLGEDFDFRYVAEGYSERQRTIFLDIPLMAHFQIGKFYAALGGKIGIPVNTTFKNSLDRLRTAAQTSYTGQTGEVIELEYNMPEIGLGYFDNISNNGKLRFKPAFFASAEVGTKLKLSEKLSLYIGAYIDYGLNNIKKEGAEQPFIDYNNTTFNNAPAVFHPNSILSSTAQQTGKPMVERVAPLAAGIRLTLAFGWGKFSEPKPKPIVIPTSKIVVRTIDKVTNSNINAEVNITLDDQEVLKGKTSSGLFSAKLKHGEYMVKATVEGYFADEQVFNHIAADTVLLALQPVPPPVMYVRLTDNATNAAIDGEVSIIQNNTEVYRGKSKDGLVSAELPKGNYTVKSTTEGYIYGEQTFNHIGNDTLTVTLQEIKKDVVIVLKNLFFAFDKANILPESEPELNRLYQFLIDNPTVRIKIVGHTDNKGTIQYNQTLSDNRAKSVLNDLIERGISASRLTSEGKNFSVPVDTNDTEEGRANNRRVEFVIQ
jgi:outer membrane protein OmpA-like peptidoglycan-associated protein